MATTIQKVAAGAAFVAGIGIGLVGGDKLTADDIQYADSVATCTVTDEVIAAHKDTLYKTVIVGKDTSQAIDQIVDIPRAVKRERAVYRSGDGDTVAVGDTVTVLILVNGVVYGETKRAVTEPPSAGKVLKVYDRLVIWEDTETAAEMVAEPIGEVVP